MQEKKGDRNRKRNRQRKGEGKDTKTNIAR